MKVAILTIRIHSNFGYIMQLYALQKAIDKIGHDAYTIQLKLEPMTIKQRIKYFAKIFVLKYIMRRQPSPIYKYPTKRQMEYMDANTWDFISHHCKLTRYFPSIEKLSELANEYDVFVVGSDQVWRHEYSADIPTYFFSFLPDGKKRIAYAASFGISENDYGEDLTQICKSLLNKFSAVGVREKTAVKLCDEVFDIKAEQVLDPTLLLTKEDYQHLIEVDKIGEVPTSPFLLLYVLDTAPEKFELAKKIADERRLVIFQIKPSDFREVGARHIDECIYPHISTWLYAFNHASYVITDSFHGTVFSIIFEKAFLTFGNKKRGLDRMATLLEMCNLKERLYDETFLDKDIAYDMVFSKLKEERVKSLRFLKTNLQS